MLVAIMGMSGHGKDTVGSVFVENGYKRFAFGDKLKEDFCKINHMNTVQFEENKNDYRDDLIEFAELTKLDKGETYWVDRVNDDVDEILNNHGDVVITDVRQWYEVKYIMDLKEKYNNVILVYVVKPLSNGGEFDMDLNTSRGINYALYHDYIDLIIYNSDTKENLIKNIKEKFSTILK